LQNHKKIVFININAYPCAIGGIEVFNHYLINELSKTHNIHVLTSCDKIDYKNAVIHYIKELKFRKFTQPLLIFIYLFKNRKSIKFIHVSYARSYWTHSFIYVIAKKVLGLKYMTTIHGGGLSQWNPQWAYKLFFKHAKSITAVSDRIIKEYAKRSNRDDLIFTPPLVPFTIIPTKDKYREKWSIKSDEIVLLYVGSIKPLKAVDSLIEALNLLTKEKIEKAKLKVLIAGDGISRKELQKRVNELNLNDNVRFLGNISREEVPELYNLANLYTICSEFEGLPVSLLEAFANNLPCITSDAPGLNNVSENNKNSLQFKTRNSLEYSKKIERLLNDSELQDKLKNNASKYYQTHFSYDKLVNDFKNIMDKI